MAYARLGKRRSAKVLSADGRQQCEHPCSVQAIPAGTIVLRIPPHLQLTVDDQSNPDLLDLIKKVPEQSWVVNRSAHATELALQVCISEFHHYPAHCSRYTWSLAWLQIEHAECLTACSRD